MQPLNMITPHDANRERLLMWTITAQPSDCSGQYVAACI